ncbi:MAG: ABC transporter ATP-binding protein [Ethanoligenens sp.]
MALLELRGVQKIYGRFKAVDGLDMSVEPGSIFGFLGRNGAGKTTSIRMMVGLARTTAGEILVCGERVRFGSPVRHIGYLPDVPAFYGTMRPLAYLTLCGQLSGMRTKTAANRAQEMLAQVGLGDVRRRIAGFSRGMKQRLGIAQAMLHHPQLLILDEPTSALDPVGREDVLQLIMALKGQVAVLFSTHVLADVQRVCDTVGILQGGRMALTGGWRNWRNSMRGIRSHWQLPCRKKLRCLPSICVRLVWCDRSQWRMTVRFLFTALTRTRSMRVSARSWRN